MQGSAADTEPDTVGAWVQLPYLGVGLPYRSRQQPVDLDDVSLGVSLLVANGDGQNDRLLGSSSRLPLQPAVASSRSAPAYASFLVAIPGFSHTNFSHSN